MGIFSKLFGKKKEKIKKTKEEKKFTWFTLHINARLQPMHGRGVGRRHAHAR